jgi:hypothetical protein
MIDNLRIRIERIENEIDIRVESIVAKAHSYGEELRMELKKFKEDFERYIKNELFFKFIKKFLN